MCLERNTENKTFVFASKIMKNSEEQKTLGIIIDNRLNSKSRAKNIFKKKPRKKNWALAIVPNVMVPK